MSKLIRPPSREVRSRIFDSARWAGYCGRAGDIVIATYPKCGTTWMQRIVGMLLAGDAAATPVGGPWPDFRLAGPVEPLSDAAEVAPGRRKLKSHLPFDALPVWEGVKFIHVARDGRDAALSMHNHLRGFRPEVNAMMDQISLADSKFGDVSPPTPENPALYFHEWLADGGGRGDLGAAYWHVERSYWAQRRSDDMLMVHYNDLKADLAGETARVARFLGIDLPPAVMEAIVAAAEFARMSAQGDALMPGAVHAWVEGSRTFLNKGVNGRWKGLFAQADLAAYEAKVAAEFTPALAAWLEGGRLVAGDPANGSD